MENITGKIGKVETCNNMVILEPFQKYVVCPVLSSSLLYSVVEYVGNELLDTYDISNCLNMKT